MVQTFIVHQIRSSRIRWRTFLDIWNYVVHFYYISSLTSGLNVHEKGFFLIHGNLGTYKYSTSSLKSTWVLSLLDHSKALYTLSHALLLSILSWIDLDARSLLFFWSYIAQNKQIVTIDCKVLKALLVKNKGVPKLNTRFFAIYCIHLTPVWWN